MQNQAPGTRAYQFPGSGRDHTPRARDLIVEVYCTLKQAKSVLSMRIADCAHVEYMQAFFSVPAASVAF